MEQAKLVQGQLQRQGNRIGSRGLDSQLEPARNQTTDARVMVNNIDTMVAQLSREWLRSSAILSMGGILG
jgi:hypothetical protein